jgi:hypothetical protein
MSKGKVGAVKKPNDPDAILRREITRTIKGAVVERLVKLIPALAAYPDPYVAVIQNPDLLFACMQLFRKQREVFQDLLVNADDMMIFDDEQPLRCERSVNQILGMVVRSGCKAYADKRWAVDPATLKPVVAKVEDKTLLNKLMELVRGKWSEAEQPKPQPNQADRFYQAINDHLNHDWQVPLIPYFAELPVKLLLELGSGCTALTNPEAIAQLADIGRHNMEQARKIMSDSMMREMLDTQPLAAKGVAFLGKERYEYLHSAVYEKMGDNFWEMCVDCDRLEAIEEQNAKDLELMSGHLHLMGAETIKQLVRLLPALHIPPFLDIAVERLGEAKFVEIFGPAGKKKLIKIFCEKTSVFKLDPGEPIEDLKRRLPDMFGAYMRHPSDFEKGL